MNGMTRSKGSEKFCENAGGAGLVQQRLSITKLARPGRDETPSGSLPTLVLNKAHPSSRATETSILTPLRLAPSNKKSIYLFCRSYRRDGAFFP